jgi:oryzin
MLNNVLRFAQKKMPLGVWLGYRLEPRARRLTSTMRVLVKAPFRTLLVSQRQDCLNHLSSLHTLKEPISSLFPPDTGLYTAHVDFHGRAVFGTNLVPNSTDNTDGNGHGTHVAGIIGSTTFGIAKLTTLIGVKVFDAGGRGQASTVIAGFQWAVNDIVSQGRQTTGVINMSLGGKASATWDAAMTAAWEQGVLAVVAAGNDNQPGANTSPCRSVEVLCVGNAQMDDTRFPGGSGSNYGDAVDVWAAGTGIVSTVPGGFNATGRLTGTSMASPHVAGLVSYLRGLEGSMAADKVRARVLELATPGLVVDAMGAANLMAYNGVEQKVGNGTNGTLALGSIAGRLVGLALGAVPVV